MIKYNLKCEKNHEFESWFADSNEFEKLRTKCLLDCIYCNSKKIEKAKKICKRFNPVILDKTSKSVVIQVTALRAEIDKLALDLKSLGLISTSRTGAVAMTKLSLIHISEPTRRM